MFLKFFSTLWLSTLLFACGKIPAEDTGPTQTITVRKNMDGGEQSIGFLACKSLSHKRDHLGSYHRNTVFSFDINKIFCNGSVESVTQYPLILGKYSLKFLRGNDSRYTGEFHELVVMDLSDPMVKACEGLKSEKEGFTGKIFSNNGQTLHQYSFSMENPLAQKITIHLSVANQNEDESWEVMSQDFMSVYSINGVQVPKKNVGIIVERETAKRCGSESKEKFSVLKSINKI